MEQTTLYYRSGTSDKVYQASIQPQGDKYLVNFAYGRRGSALQTGSKTPVPVDCATARAIYERLLKEKMAKGYTVGADGTPYAHSAMAAVATGVVPQLLNPVEENEISALLKSPFWWVQQKHDGERRLIRKRGEEVIGINRRGLQVSLPQPWVEECLRCSTDFLIDGEAVGDTLYVFDLLSMGEKELRDYPYLGRYLSLMQLLTKWGSNFTRLVKSVCTDGEKERYFDELRRNQAEGVVFRRLDEPYTAGRPASGGTALKFKFVASASFIVSRVNARRSVSLALLEDGVARSAGNVTVPPNHDLPEIGTVVEVRYLYAFRESGHIYQPVYLGARNDLPHEDCTSSQLKYKAVVPGKELAA